MAQKKELKLDKGDVQNLIYPLMFAAVIVISLIVFAISLNFLFKSISKASTVDNQALRESAIKFEVNNLTHLKRYLPGAF